VGPTNRLRDGLAILRAIAKSDAVRDVRERLREGAMAIAESEKVPRVLAAASGVVAALLDEPAAVYARGDTSAPGVDSWAEGDDRREREGASRQGPEEDDEAELDELDDDLHEPAAVRDLRGAEDLEEQLLGTEAAHDEDEDDGEDRLLRFEVTERSEGQPGLEDDDTGPRGGSPATHPSARRVRSPRSLAVKKGRGGGNTKKVEAKRAGKAEPAKAPRAPKSSRAKAEKPPSAPISSTERATSARRTTQRKK